MASSGKFQSITHPPEKMEKNYDAIVIGSGYGAGVAASRLSRMGLKVCVLERGREFLPGDFPDTLRDGMKEFQSTTRLGHMGADDALFDMRVSPDISVLVGCGLGGTSLINGNVMLVPDRRVLEDAAWPVQLRRSIAGDLQAGYDLARTWLGSVPYAGTPALKKIRAFEKSAADLGGRFSYPPINITFEETMTGNAAGISQPTCTLCGDCCSGCNIGAKNTVAMNYLPDAYKHGAAIFTGAKVSHIEQNGAGWRVVLSGNAARTVQAPVIVCGAGTLGSTEIMLRSRENGLSLSPRLGEQFSGNGDVIAFGYNNDVPVNGIGTGQRQMADQDVVGPVIAGLIDLRDTDDLADAMVIQEGAIPSLLAPIFPAMMVSGSPLFGDDTDEGDSLEEAARAAKSLFKGAYKGAIHNTQTFLVMAHDTASGIMQLKDGKVSFKWPDAGKAKIYEKISATLRAATAANGGTFINNPMWSKSLGRNLVSVHPLGGCAMGDDVDSGVVDHKNAVFASSGEVLEGLYIMDGSAMPRSLGVNPSLTITAVSERAMMLFARNHGLQLNTIPLNKPSV